MSNMVGVLISGAKNFVTLLGAPWFLSLLAPPLLPQIPQPPILWSHRRGSSSGRNLHTIEPQTPRESIEHCPSPSPAPLVPLYYHYQYRVARRLWLPARRLWLPAWCRPAHHHQYHQYHHQYHHHYYHPLPLIPPAVLPLGGLPIPRHPACCGLTPACGKPRAGPPVDSPTATQHLGHRPCTGRRGERTHPRRVPVRVPYHQNP